MKREYIYIAVILALTILGVLYKSFFLSETIEKAQILIENNGDASAKFYRDSLVQQNSKVSKESFTFNKRDARAYGDVIVELLSFTEDLLKKSGATYKVNDINQDIEEVKDYKKGISSFFINVKFNADYKNVKDLLVSIEKSPMVINVDELELSREIQSSDKGEAQVSLDEESDEYNKKAFLKVKLRLEFVKFL